MDIFLNQINPKNQRYKERQHIHIEQEKNEHLMIMLPNTVYYPWAVVVHSHDASFADFTVVHPW